LDHRIKSIIEFIKTNIDKKLTLKELSNIFEISYCHLSFLFKKETGMTFSKYYRSLRIRYAKIRLRRSCFDIKEISYSLGYSDLSHFYRDFKILVETTPREFRKSRESNNVRKYVEKIPKKYKPPENWTIDS